MSTHGTCGTCRLNDVVRAPSRPDRHLRRLVDDAFESVDEHQLATITEQWCRLALDRVLAKGEATSWASTRGPCPCS